TPSHLRLYGRGRSPMWATPAPWRPVRCRPHGSNGSAPGSNASSTTGTATSSPESGQHTRTCRPSNRVDPERKNTSTRSPPCATRSKPTCNSPSGHPTRTSTTEGDHAMSQFASPATPSGIEWASLKGSLLVIEPVEVVKDIATSFGTTDAVRATVTVVDGPKAGETYEDALVFPKVLQAQLSSRVGQ